MFWRRKQEQGLMKFFVLKRFSQNHKDDDLKSKEFPFLNFFEWQQRRDLINNRKHKKIKRFW